MDFLQRYIFLIVPIVAGFIAHALKILFSLRKDGLQWHDLWTSGHMPSSHSAFVTGLATIIGLRLGFASVSFAIAFVGACIVAYDAAGVRRTTGEQTLAIHELEHKLLSPKHLSRRIHEAAGHSPNQVIVGISLGLGVAILLNGLIF